METLRNARKEANMSAKEVAQKLGVTTTTIYAWERGQINPTLDHLRQLEKLYNRHDIVYNLVDELNDKKEVKQVKQGEQKANTPRNEVINKLKVRFIVEYDYIPEYREPFVARVTALIPEGMIDLLKTRETIFFDIPLQTLADREKTGKYYKLQVNHGEYRGWKRLKKNVYRYIEDEADKLAEVIEKNLRGHNTIPTKEILDINIKEA